MFEIKVTQNPYAVEIHRDGVSIGTIRWDHQWRVAFAAPEGYIELPWEAITLIAEFRKSHPLG